MEVNGRDVTGWTTANAIDAGVGMVHQHFMLVPTLTRRRKRDARPELTRGLQLDTARAEHEVEALSRTTGLSVHPKRLVADLSVGEAQRVEILKTLYRGARILIPTNRRPCSRRPKSTSCGKCCGKCAISATRSCSSPTSSMRVMEISDTIT